MAQVLAVVAALLTAAFSVCAQPADTTAVSAGAARFRRISVEDRQVIGGEAASFLVPADWHVQGGVVWRAHPVLPAGAHIRASAPRSRQQVEAFPSFPFTWGDNCGPGKLMPVGASWFGNEVHPPFASARACLETLIIPRVRSAVRWRVTQREDLPRLAAAHRKHTPGEPGAHIFYDAARVRIEYLLDGAPVEEDLFAVLQTTRVPAGNIVIQVADRVVAMRAERGMLEASRPVHLAIVNSSKINLKWFNTYAQLVEAAIRAKMQEIKAVGEFSRALSRTSSQISEQRMRQWQDTQQRQDRLNREWSEYIRGTETYNDPVRGERVELPSTHRYAWVSRAGEYILTDDPNFNPNVERRGDWVEMQPTP
ncbi:MAG: hypothetical protein MUD16_01635 [Desulfobacterales bacterium]|jgi:hypothetical protein|nr:hypothetical protein [Desulfobacterales bacterium]